MRLWKFYATALFAIAAAPNLSASELTKFTTLPRSDRIRVEYKSAGCFHYCTNTLEIIGGRSPQVILLTNSLPVQNFPSFSLTPDEVSGLDRLLEFYRQPRPGGCTTVDKIVFTQLRGNTVIASESFTDESCMLRRTSAPEATKKITNLHTLIFRLEEAQIRPPRPLRGRP